MHICIYKSSGFSFNNSLPFSFYYPFSHTNLLHSYLLEYFKIKSYHIISKVGDTRMKLNEVFGNNVKYFRFRKKYTQEKVAELTDMSVTYISQLELGHHTPSFERLEVLSKVLGVEPFEFFVSRNLKKLPARVDMADDK